MADILWVCASPKKAGERQKAFCDAANVTFISVGAMLCGSRFSEIILDDIYANVHDSEVMREKISQWLDDCVVCRLTSDGRMKSLNDFEGTTHVDSES